METKSYTPVLFHVIWLVAAESPMKMFFQGVTAPFPS